VGRRRGGGSARATAVALAIGILVGAAIVEVVTPAEEAPVAGASWRPERGNGQRFAPAERAIVLRYAFRTEPWAKDLLDERDAVKSQLDPVLGWTYVDRTGTLLTIRNGKRASYVPAHPQLTVWFFGGSTMYGGAQRNGHTIPSMVAKLAERDGIRIRPVNFGVEGYNAYQESLEFARALTLEAAPDLVVFYDGVNEITTAVERVTVGYLDAKVPYFVAVGPERGTRGTSARTAAWTDEQRNERTVELAATQYRQAAATADGLARSVGVPVVRYWQPTLATTPKRPFAAPLYDRLGADDETMREGRSMYDAIRTRSGVETTDLRNALAGVDRPTFFDWEHTNELGAAIVARAMYRDLAGRLRGLAG
jgi:hypothetical protein